MTKSIINTPLVIIGFGSQAKAWALNLRDSGQEVIMALRPQSPSQEVVQKLGFKFLILGEEDFPKNMSLLLLIPDHLHGSFLKEHHPLIPKGTRLIYAHGFSLVKEALNENYPKFSHLLLAPKAIASEVRLQYETGGKLGAAYSLEHSLKPKEDTIFLKELARQIGITAGPYLTNFQDEAYADLFSEQGLLCGLIPYAAHLCYQKLREKGISKEVAYMECWLEVKLISDAMVKLGPYEFFKLISPNALVGGEKARKQLVSAEFSQTLDGLIDDIWAKKFFAESEQTNFQGLQQEVLNFWEKEELTETHQELAKEFF